MTDLFENAGMELGLGPSKGARPRTKIRRFVGMTPREFIMLGAAIAIFIWGAWVTKNLVEIKQATQILQ